MDNRIQAVVLDWAGTVVDYGCFAPIHAFVEAFADFGVEITVDEARKPMGLLKKDHVKEIIAMDRVRNKWIETYGNQPTRQDMDALYRMFEKKLFESLHEFTDPVPGAIETIDVLKSRKIKIGSTTGYTREMMAVVAANAKRKGYEPDAIVCADEVTRGRPYPYMIFQNMIKLEVFPPQAVMKVGDTEADMREGKNAGVWTVAVVKGSSELGLSAAEMESMPPEELERRIAQVTNVFQTAGADYVTSSIHELPDVIEKIEKMSGKDRNDESVL
ncbi:phosphonoacetaldehyde hydrolase [Evansella caseinilytica]|uniref:Phosphonoacetaldehyde hydrolase n=1 Tax=Evansella caseinilytica TaxID=1503961 RepID=A0A1H3HWW5_9BACI|nr:phosphonoacetaldehyde hydrolase [Evansella caseinilytica]SDY19254.1 phosphonoacetaldehyde hydrolase [Evansella caseinilytica]